MKAITVRLRPDERRQLEKIKDAGFSSLGEVIKCATLSLVETAQKPKPQPARSR